MGINQSFSGNDVFHYSYPKPHISPPIISPNPPEPDCGIKIVPSFSILFNIFNKEKKYELYL